MNTTPAYALRQIVAATDLSPPAQQAARRAALLAGRCGARLHLVHVVGGGLLDELRAWLDDGAQWQSHLLEQARETLTHEAAQLAQASGAQVDPVLVVGQAVPAICDQADALGADLVVAGARGSQPLHHLLIGSTAERLLGKTLAPLLVVRTEAHKPYERVLVPLDFSPWSARAIDVARRVAPGALLVLMHSFSIPFEEKLRFSGVNEVTLDHYRERARQDALQHLQDLVQRHGLLPDDFAMSLTEGDASTDIVAQAQARQCDLIVIGKHGRQAAEELLLGSVTRQVLADAGIDVLVSTAHDTP